MLQGAAHHLPGGENVPQFSSPVGEKPDPEFSPKNAEGFGGSPRPAECWSINVAGPGSGDDPTTRPMAELRRRHQPSRFTLSVQRLIENVHQLLVDGSTEPRAQPAHPFFEERPIKDYGSCTRSAILMPRLFTAARRFLISAMGEWETMKVGDGRRPARRTAS